MVSLEEFLEGLQREKNRREQNKRTREALEKKEIRSFLYGRLCDAAAKKNEEEKKMIETKKNALPVVKEQDVQVKVDEVNHQEHYSMDEACVKLLSTVLMHNRIPAKKFEYDFDYDAGSMSNDFRSYGPEVKLIRSFDWRYLAWGGANFNDGYELLHLRDADAVMDAIRLVASDVEVFA